MRRLREHDLVNLSLPGERQGGNSRYHVVAMFGASAALHPIDPVALEHLPESAPDSFVSFQHGGHLVALRGTVLYSNDVVRFRVSDGVSLPRRSSTRIEFVTPLTVRRRAGPSAQGMTLDIALDGVLIESEIVLQVGEEILLSIAFPTREAPIETAARVVRVEDSRAGVAFASMDQEARRFLSAQIYERSLAALTRDRAAPRIDDDLF